MTRKQAQLLLDDWTYAIEEKDLCENIYVSIKSVGTKVFKKCCYHETENYIFIWTKEDKFLINKKELGDFVIIPQNSKSFLLTKKVT
jgi:hypothetical protein